VGLDRPPVLTPAGRHVTLQPRDLIFTRTAGKMQPIQVGDVVEVELQGAGVLRNKVAAGK
jgi:5-oxopent-3-ene-1,2,5-tricarboxylate decarboxylase/2-hydroxyhepta-2,4-diene-1,7-dioate isomerase